jgi:hypothetical protein
MIRDILIPEVKKTFSGWEMEISYEVNPIIRFPAVQKEVGDVLISDDGDEATIYLQKITHHHVNPYDECTSSVKVVILSLQAEGLP